MISSLLKFWNIWSLSWPSCETLCMVLVCCRQSLVQLSLLNKIFIATTVKSSLWLFHMRVTSLLGNFSWVSLYSGVRVLWVLWTQFFKWEFSPVNKILIGKSWGSSMDGLFALWEEVVGPGPVQPRRVPGLPEGEERATGKPKSSWGPWLSLARSGFSVLNGLDSWNYRLSCQRYPIRKWAMGVYGSSLPFLRMQFEEHFLCTPVLI